jgi:hypothetical protein
LQNANAHWDRRANETVFGSDPYRMTLHDLVDGVT